MSKSIGRVFGTGSTSQYGYEQNYLNYLRNYDTSNYDNTLNNMTSAALAMSGNLSSMPNYQFNADGSDAARQRAEAAIYQNYLDKLTPQFTRQGNDMQTRLSNQGIPVGSAAYNRAMSNLYDSQNSALNEAAYKSVLAGQDAFSQSYADSLRGAQFANNAQSNYIDLIKSLLDGSVSGYDNASNLYNTASGVRARQDAARQSAWNNAMGMVGGFAGVYSGK